MIYIDQLSELTKEYHQNFNLHACCFKKLTGQPA